MLPFHQPTLIPLPRELRTGGIIIRPFRDGDGPSLFRAIQSSRASLEEYLPWPKKHSCPADSEDYVRRAHARFLLREDLTVAITNGQGDILGGSGLHNPDWRARSFEIGYWLRDDARLAGHASNTVMLLSALAFFALGARRVFMRCEEGNARSIALPRRLGFHEEGCLRRCHRSHARKRYVDMLIFSLIRSDLNALPWYRAAKRRVERAPFDDDPN